MKTWMIVLLVIALFLCGTFLTFAAPQQVLVTMNGKSFSDFKVISGQVYVNLLKTAPLFGANVSREKKSQTYHVQVPKTATKDTNTIQKPVDVTQPTAPANVKLQMIDNQKISLTWDDPADQGNNQRGIASYDIFRNDEWIATIPTTSFVDPNVKSGYSYSYDIRSKDVAGNISKFAPTMRIVIHEPSRSELTAPNLSFVSIQDGQVNLQIQKIISNVVDEKSVIELYRNGLKLAVLSAKDTNFSDRLTTASTTYRYTARFVDSSGNTSKFSEELVVNVPDYSIK